MLGITVQNLTRHFRDVVALDQISLSFEPGLIHGIIGPEGAGKTTLIRTLLGLLLVQEGQIIFKQSDQVLNFSEARDFLAYMPEKQSLYGDLSIREHLHFFADLYGMSHSEFQIKSQKLLHLTRLEPFQQRIASQLSGGMYKKLGLMCALLRSPKVLLLDEPTNGVDPISRREFWEMLHQLTLEMGMTILIATAYMDEAERCEKVHLLENGHLLASGIPQDLLQLYAVNTFDELFIKKVLL